MDQFQSNSIFWVEVDKIRPNPFQPRTDFDESSLRSLADSIRQYGVLQPLVVTRHEEEKAMVAFQPTTNLLQGSVDYAPQNFLV